MLRLIAVLLSAALSWAPPVGDAKRIETLRRYGLDPTSSLESRVAGTPASVLKMFEELGPPAPTPHSLAPDERKQLDEAIAALPPLHRRVLTQRLRTLSFLDGMPNTALTSTVNPDGDYELFDITLRAGVFRQTVSEWLTEKERTCFGASGSALSVSIEAGSRPAIVYALLHEATHVVDSSLHVNPAPAEGGRPAAAANTSAFTRGVWADASTPAASFRDPLLESSHFRQGGRVLPIGDAERVYEALERTPFASLYGSRNWFDDLAEYVALYEMTHTLGQPYRIVIQQGGQTVFTYEPMKSRLVLERAAAIRELLTPWLRQSASPGPGTPLTPRPTGVSAPVAQRLQPRPL